MKIPLLYILIPNQKNSYFISSNTWYDTCNDDYDDDDDDNDDHDYSDNGDDYDDDDNDD